MCSVHISPCGFTNNTHFLAYQDYYREVYKYKNLGWANIKDNFELFIKIYKI